MFAWGLLGPPRRESSVLPTSKRLQCPAFLPLQIRARPKIQESSTPPPLLSGHCSSGPPPRPTQQWLPGDGWEAAVPELSQAGRLGTAQLVLTAALTKPSWAFPRCRPAVRCAAGGAGGWNRSRQRGNWGPETLGMTFLNL